MGDEGMQSTRLWHCGGVIEFLVLHLRQCQLTADEGLFGRKEDLRPVPTPGFRPGRTGAIYVSSGLSHIVDYRMRVIVNRQGYRRRIARCYFSRRRGDLRKLNDK